MYESIKYIVTWKLGDGGKREGRGWGGGGRGLKVPAPS